MMLVKVIRKILLAVAGSAAKVVIKFTCSQGWHLGYGIKLCVISRFGFDVEDLTITGAERGVNLGLLRPCFAPTIPL